LAFQGKRTVRIKIVLDQVTGEIDNNYLGCDNSSDNDNDINNKTTK
jgi:hypothetical protein